MQLGLLCDRYGPRTVQTVLLVLGSTPVASVALVTNYNAFIIVRFFTGLVGCSIIAATYWTSVMFCTEIVGRANSLASGWGNLGAGVTYLITPLIYDLFTIHAAVSDDTSWRLTLILPAIFVVVIGFCLYQYSDDCPQGNHCDLKPFREPERRPAVSEMTPSIWTTLSRPATWILAYHTRLISSLFGLMCIFARGGYASDIINLKYSIKGRTRIHCFIFTCQAVFLYLYIQATDLSWSTMLGQHRLPRHIRHGNPERFQLLSRFKEAGRSE